MNDILENCPFCGHRVSLEIDEFEVRDKNWNVYIHWLIECCKCHCSKSRGGEYIIRNDLTIKTLENTDPRQKLIQEWNTRGGKMKNG